MSALTDASADRIYQALRAYHERGTDDTALRALTAAAAQQMARVTDALRYDDLGSGLRRLLDPARTPAWALPWLAQLVGLTLDPSLPEDQQRAQITAPPGFRRGTPAAMAAAAQTTLIGTKHVALVERNGSAYKLAVFTRTSETPDPAATEAAVRAQKPAGLILTYAATTMETWDEATSTWDAPAVSWDNATSV